MKSIVLDSDLKYLEIFHNKLTQTGKIRVDVFKYQPTWDEEYSKQWENELFIIKEKYHNINIQLKERIPINSKTPDHYWYLTKDIYGNYYIFLAPSKFEERFVWKLQYKIYYLLESYAEHIEEDKLDDRLNLLSEETIREKINMHVTAIIKDFNNKIFKEMNLSSHINFSQSTVRKQYDISKQSQGSAPDFFDNIRFRNQRLVFVQQISLLSLIVSIALFIVHFATS